VTDFNAIKTGDIGVAFMDALSANEQRELLSQRRAGLTAELETLQHTAAEAHRGSFALIIAHQIHHLRAELNWLDEIAVYIAKGEAQA
jgi:hypothetical protein